MNALLTATLLALLGAASFVQASDERFYGKEKFTVVSVQSGAETGTITEHVRDWGRKRVEIKDTTMTMMGVTRRAQTRVIYDGDQIITTDLVTGAVTRARNPMYQQLVQSMAGKDGVEFGKQMMLGMGASETGESGDFAGQKCHYWKLPQFGSRTCVTDFGVTLYNSTAMMGMTIERTATAVRLGDGGADEAFKYDAGKIQEAPNLQDILKKMGSKNQGAVKE
jgi:hypothetical protein